MDIAFIGLGRMGANMGTRALRAGHTVFGYDPADEARQRLDADGGKSATDLHGLVALMPSTPRAFWIMVPSGPPVDGAIHTLLPLLSEGDILIDGGNSNFRDSQRRYETLKEHGIHFLDCGTSGGIWGLSEGYCMMLGGDEEAFRVVEPLLKSLAPNADGYRLVGPSGAGHFSKMIHNGIEYGLMQAYAEGFEILEKSEFAFDMHGLAKLWNQGSVVRSWLLELAERAFEHDDSLEKIVGYVEDTGEGRWTVQAALDENVPAPAITMALQMRFRSRQQDSFSAKVVAALRHQFGGHAVKLSEEPGTTHTEPTPAESGHGRHDANVDVDTVAFSPEQTMMGQPSDAPAAAQPASAKRGER
ncbi:MAG TPA: decarboxylating 6-phosphogluconate dehydrogenase [Armatimonadota bacterium]|jgi:6-phosphogluconate dehydrogenase